METNTPYSREFYLGQQGGSYRVCQRDRADREGNLRATIGVRRWLWRRDMAQGVERQRRHRDSRIGWRIRRSVAAHDRCQDDFRCHDLRKPLPSDAKYDLAMSLEVAEHLPPDRSESFIAELTALAPVVLFSAAIPQQGGTDHINERWQSYWAGLFEKQGFSPLDVIRPAVWENDAVERWYRQNTIVYCCNDVVADYASRSADQKLPLSIVHPKQYIEIRQEYNVAGAFELLRDAVHRAVLRRLRKDPR